MYDRPLWLVVNLLALCMLGATLFFSINEAKEYMGDDWSNKDYWNFSAK